MKNLFPLTLLLVAGVASAAVDCQTNINPTGVRDGVTYVGNANLTGCLTSPTGLTNTYNGRNTSVAWSITSATGGYNYDYTVRTSGSPDISHFIIGLSSTCTGITSRTSTGCITILATDPVEDIEISGASGFPAGGGSNPGMPANLYGIKFDTDNDPKTFTVSFFSARIPVWQNFYMKGAGVGSWNTGFTATGTSYYIAAPDTIPMNVVPEPSTYAALAASIGAVVAGARRRRRS
jgi:hypothetical protein